MNIETVVRDHPTLTLVTVAGVASAATVLAFREMGCKPTRPSGASGFVWDHPVLSALGTIGLAFCAERLLSGGAGSFMTGARRAASASHGYRRPGQPHQQIPRYQGPARQGSGQQHPGGGVRPGALGQHPGLQRPQVPGRAASPPQVQTAPYASTQAPSYQSPAGGAAPQMRTVTTSSTQQPAHQQQQTPSWAADVQHDFHWPPS